MAYVGKPSPIAIQRVYKLMLYVSVLDPMQLENCMLARRSLMQSSKLKFEFGLPWCAGYASEMGWTLNFQANASPYARHFSCCLSVLSGRLNLLLDSGQAWEG